MATMSDLRACADELMGLGLTKHRAFRVLRKRFPDAERDQLLLVIPLRGAPKHVTPTWALWGQPLRPTQIRFLPKNRKKHPKETQPVIITTRERSDEGRIA